MSELVNAVPNNFLKLPKLLRKIFIKKETYRGGVYLDQNLSFTNEITDRIVWLGEITVLAKSKKGLELAAQIYFNKKFSKYKGFIKLF